MEQPKVVKEKQLELNFGEKYSEVAFKETERVVRVFLRCLYQLGVDAETVNHVMMIIATDDNGVAAHTEVD